MLKFFQETTVTMKQAKLFQQDEPELLTELDFESALALANRVKNLVQIHCEKLEVVGSIRRQRPKIHDVDFVVVTPNDAEWLKIGTELKRIKVQTSCAGNVVIKVYVPCNNGLFQVDFYRAKPSTFGINQLIRTGSADHNMWLAGYAISKGMRIKYSEGLVKDGVVVAGETEEGVFTALELPCPVPSEREVVDGKPVWQKEEQAEKP
jgi:DNA polymerase/3'-5' exonuclease PolX